MLDKIKNLIFPKDSSFRNSCILVFEDNKVDSKLLQAILNKEYSNVLIAENARIGLEKARNEKPDLIVLDYNLPDLQGGDVLSELKSDDKTKEIPVIVLTAERTPKNVCDSFSNSAESFLLKPINRQTLISEINKNLKVSKTR